MRDARTHVRRVGERAKHAREQAVSERERTLELRDRALCAVAEADAAREERERLMGQMREANEKLVLATIRAEELVERAVAARALAHQSATIEAERRRHAEVIATQLLASENALRSRERKAQATIRAKDEFVAMLGHELRSPLAPILLALDLIALDAGDTHEREHRIIARQVHQLARLVDDLLDVARLESGKIELRREPVEAADIVSRAIETAGPLIESKNHTLTVEVPAEGLEIDGDVSRLTQVIGNLLTNAAKYTPSNGYISVTAERRGSMVVLRVRDAGIGISAQMLPRIFDLFAQETQPADRAPGGLGLGLAIVRSLVALHGGTVTAHSEGIGRGTELVVELPALAPGPMASRID
jgi:signal transduction histidine kinase